MRPLRKEQNTNRTIERRCCYCKNSRHGTSRYPDSSEPDKNYERCGKRGPKIDACWSCFTVADAYQAENLKRHGCASSMTSADGLLCKRSSPSNEWGDQEDGKVHFLGESVCDTSNQYINIYIYIYIYVCTAVNRSADGKAVLKSHCTNNEVPVPMHSSLNTPPKFLLQKKTEQIRVKKQHRAMKGSKKPEA